MRTSESINQGPLSIILFAVLFLSINLANCQTITNQDDLSWAKENPRLKSGNLLVPENHDNPDGKKIHIAYVIVKSKDSTSNAYPLVLFTGGPGGNTIDPGLVGFLSDHPFSEKRDVILFDQRGIGYSSSLPNMGFDSFGILASNADEKKELELSIQMIENYKKKCSDLGINPEHYNSTQNAKDVGALFDHLGYEKYNLSGGSYGTLLARMVQDFFPEKVHVSILDSPALLSTDFLQMRLENYSLSLKRIMDHCKTDSECNKKYPNLEADYYRSISILEKRPIKVRVKDSIDFYINAQDGIYLLRRLLYQDNSREKAPELIQAFIKGEGDIIKDVVEFEYELTGILNLTMLLSVEKAESFDPRNTPEVIAQSYKKYPLIPAKLGFFDAFYQAGMNWHEGNLPMEKRQFMDSEIPTLIFVNRYDPVTPPKNGRLFKEKLSKGQLFILDEGGHGGGNRECKFQVILDFMGAPDKPLDSSCLNIYKE
ncbi:MAG: alpha/beta hydrolase [Bacteroidia bacterium]|nr:alpha/beta hydrolase [Bacteroidia bacterium]